MSDMMLAAVLHGAMDIRLEEVDQPKPNDLEVLLKVRRAGICGSDIHYYKHGQCGAFVPSQPFILGHEFVADVVAVGQRVCTPQVGQRVVVNPAASCGQCVSCKAGRSNLCDGVVMLGSASTTPPTNGAFAERIVVPAHQCHVVPDTVTDEIAAIMEPLSVVLHAVSRCGGFVGARVLVCGGGPIGLLAVQVSIALGASFVVVSEPQSQRRNQARQFGAVLALDPLEEHFVDECRAVSEGGFDIVLEASGATAAIQSTVQVARRGAAIVQIGTVSEANVPLPVNDLMVRELSFLGSFRYADEFATAIQLAAQQRLELAPLVTAVFPLQQASEAMEHVVSNAEALKVHLAAASS